MVDSFSVTTHNSYGSRIKNSFSKIGFGFILLIVSICILFRNENNYVDTKKAYEEGEKIVQEANIDSIDSDLEGALIHVTGKTHSDADTLIDPTFGVKTDQLKLYRYVEMYQWYEESDTKCTDNVGGSEDCTTTYNYHKKRDDERINSSNFYESNSHQNPSEWIYKSDQREKDPITVGAYTLSPSFTQQLTNTKAISLNEQVLSINSFNDNRGDILTSNNPKIDKNTTESIECTETQKEAEICTMELMPVCGSDGNNYDNKCYACRTQGVVSYTEGECPTISAAENPTETTTVSDPNSNIHVYDSYIYIGKDPSNPEIGDIKISFKSVPEYTVSLIGKQNESEIGKYTASNKKGFALLQEGTISAEDMFTQAKAENKFMTRILRFLGLLLMYIAFNMIFEILVTLSKVLPFLSNIIGTGTGIVSFGLTIVIGFITIGLAWLYARPIIGISILICGLGLGYLIFQSKKNQLKTINTQPETTDTNLQN